MSYPRDPLGMRMRVAPGADFTALPSTYTWIDVTDDLQLTVPITHKRGTDDEESESNSESTFALKSETGRYVTDNALSDLWPDFAENCPIMFETNIGDGTGWHQEWIQYLGDAVDDWPGGTPNLCNTYITCNGLFRRLGQGDALGSPLQRTMSGLAPGDYVAHAQWSMEDSGSATQFASSIVGGVAVTPSGEVEFGSDDRLIGSDSLPIFGDGAFAYFPIPTYADTGHWLIQFPVLIPSTPSGIKTFAEITTTGGAKKITLELDTVTFSPEHTLYVRAYNASGTLINEVTQGTFGAEFYDTWRMVSIAWTNDVSAPYTDNLLWFDVATTASEVNLNGVFIGSTDGIATGVKLLAPMPGVGFGHLGFFKDALSGDPDEVFPELQAAIFNNVAAMNGHAGETEVERLERLCREAQIPFETTATESNVTMGPQLIDTLLANFRDCERAGHGMLDDSQGSVGYWALTQFYNQDPAFIIDGAERNRLFMPFSPTTDDQQRRNRVTATRTGGSSYTHENTDDINGVPGMRPGVGVFDGDIEVNIETDTDLLLHASHAVALGTIVGKRYPSLTIDLRRAPDLIPDYRNLRLAGRATIINPPRQHNRAPVDLLLPGWSTVINGLRGAWTVTANCTRYDPYIAGIMGDASTSSAWLQCDKTSVLAAELAPGGTSVSVTMVPLATTSADLVTHPLSLIIGGEIVPVSNVAGASNPQTFTVTRTLNKRHPVGTPVQVYRPLLLVL